MIFNMLTLIIINLNSVFALMGKPQSFNKGDELYKNGFVCIISSGSAVIKRKSGSDGEINVKTVSSGGIFGVASVFGKWHDIKSSVIAKEKCELYILNEEILQKIFILHPTVCFNYIKFLSDRIRFLNARIDTFSAESTAKKLYEYLLNLSGDTQSVRLEISLSELARRLGVGRSSLYRDMSFLENEGLISRSGKTFKIVKPYMKEEFL